MGEKDGQLWHFRIEQFAYYFKLVSFQVTAAFYLKAKIFRLQKSFIQRPQSAHAGVQRAKTIPQARSLLDYTWSSLLRQWHTLSRTDSSSQIVVRLGLYARRSQSSSQPCSQA